jgi:hypothetical protein
VAPEKIELVTTEERRVDEAIRWLARQKEIMETELTLRAKEIGDYLIHSFFDDDLDLLASQNPTKNVSFRKLCERGDLPFTEGALRRFMHVAVNFRYLPLEKAKELPPSHHDVLYQVADPQERCRIGCEAVEGAVSVRKLRELVKGKGRRRPGAGRKPSPDFVKNWRQVVQAVEKLSGKIDDKESLDRHKLDDLWRETRQVRDQLNQVIDRILEMQREH